MNKASPHSEFNQYKMQFLLKQSSSENLQSTYKIPFFSLRYQIWPMNLVQVFFCVWLWKWLMRPIRAGKPLPQNGPQRYSWRSCLLPFFYCGQCSVFLIWNSPCGDEIAPRGALLCWSFERVDIMKKSFSVTFEVSLKRFFWPPTKHLPWTQFSINKLLWDVVVWHSVNGPDHLICALCTRV